MKDSSVYCIVFMFVLATVASGILIGVDRFTADRVALNEQLQKSRSVMEAFGLADDETPAEKIVSDYESRVKVVLKNENAEAVRENIIEYQLKAEGSDEIISYAIPVYGKGFWDMIGGVLAVESDRKTIIGLSFYEQKETPGLGAEIENPVWRASFEGKKLAESGKAIKIKGAGEELSDSSVQAVTGATQTSTRVEKFMNACIAQWREQTE